MSFANIIPIRRMPADRPWLTYRVPDELKVMPGMLVTIPLRGRGILGVVWSLEPDQSSQYKIQDITAIHFSYPLMTKFQMQVCDIMADTGAVSLGTVLFSMLPKITLRSYKKIFSTELPEQKKNLATPAIAEHLWYRDRREGLTWLQKQTASNKNSSTLIITPTVQDIKEIISIIEASGQSCCEVDADITPTAFAKIYQRVLCGEQLVIIGTLKALALPWPKLPHIILDQEEHHAHKQTAQHPRYDARVVLRVLSQPWSYTTPAPSLITWSQQAIQAPTPFERQLTSLQRPGAFSWLTDETITLIEDCIANKKTVICIAPRRGYASASVCKSCGTAQTCPTCGQRTALFRGTNDQAVCHFCKTSVSLHVICPVCQSTNWTVRGLGLEQVVALSQERWPEATVTPIVSSDVPADIAVDSYLAYHQIRKIKNVGAIIVVSGDSLLSLPDYSTAERAWQYLARLQAESPHVPMIVQTFNPEHTFWQRWLHGDDQTWYTSELADRQRLHLPPSVTQWVAHYHGDEKVFHTVEQELIKKYTGRLDIRPLPNSRQRSQRLLLTFTDAKLVDQLPWLELFSNDWQLDKFPQSWLD